MNNKQDISAPFTISNSLYSGVSSVTIVLSLTNYFGKVAVASGTVAISGNPNAPVLNIVGSKSLAIDPSSQLSIQSTVSFSSCATGKKLSYAWEIYDSSSNLLEYSSSSSDPSKFLLAAYTLTAGKSYTATVTVTVAATSLYAAVSSSLSVSVYVDHGDISAIVSGGYQRGDPEDTAISLDASGSVDYDYGPGNSAAYLGYAWSCVIGDDANYGDDNNNYDVDDEADDDDDDDDDG
jgi:hypothetical protein